VPAHAAVRYESARHQVDAVVYDLSTSGLFVQTAHGDHPGTEARLSLRSYLSRKPLELRCRVARSGDRPARGMGLALVDPDPIAQSVLQSYCEQVQRERRVLMVDDEPAILRMFARVLRAEGLGFVGIDLPLDAEAIVNRFRPQVVVLDVMMPQLDGIAIARRLRDNPETAGLPLAFYSGSPKWVLPPDLRDVPFVQKGGQRDELLNEVTRLLQLSSTKVL